MRRLPIASPPQPSAPLRDRRTARSGRQPGQLAIAGALLACAAGAARASCPVALDGDPAVVAQVRAALEAFGGDGAPCVAVRAVCGREGGELALELRDELGRTAQRRFVGADGAAAFLISWSRRPLLIEGGVVSPAPPAIEDGLHGELHLAYLGALDSTHPFVAAMGAVVRRRGLWRYGGDLRVIGAPVQNFYGNSVPPDALVWLGFDAEATGGVVVHPQDWLRVRGEVGAGAAYVTMLTSSMDPIFQSAGLRAGIRAAIASRLTSATWLELGAGWDVLCQLGPLPNPSPFGDQTLYTQLHLEVGLAWDL